MTRRHRARLRATFARLRNGLRRIAARLPPAQEAVWPGVRNDLFVAHESVYRFAVRWVAGRRVLDAACGTGYGSHLLASSGAAQVLGVDLDARRIAYARRCFRAPNLAFERHDIAALALAPESIDVVVSSNTLEHLARPADFLRAVRPALASGGVLVVTVPPVLSEADLVAHGVNPFHPSPLSVGAWAELFRADGWTIDFFAQYCSGPLDFASPHASALGPEAFAFLAGDPELAYARPPISATYVLRRVGFANGRAGGVAD